MADQYAQYATTGDILNENVQAMFWVHLLCFLMLSWQTIFALFNIHAYHSFFIGSMSIPIYIMGILKAQETLSIMENYMKLGCFRNQMGETVTWLNIEIWVFWVNISVLMMYVIWKKYSSLDETKARHDIWKGLMNKELLSHFSWNNKTHDKAVECGKDGMVNESHIWIVDDHDIE